jgi:hypothetical protein
VAAVASQETNGGELRIIDDEIVAAVPTPEWAGVMRADGSGVVGYGRKRAADTADDDTLGTDRSGDDGFAAGDDQALTPPHVDVFHPDAGIAKGGLGGSGIGDSVFDHEPVELQGQLDADGLLALAANEVDDSPTEYDPNRLVRRGGGSRTGSGGLRGPPG